MTTRQQLTISFKAALILILILKTDLSFEGDHTYWQIISI